MGRRGPAQPGGADDELCATFDESSQCTIVLLEEGLGYGLVVPFPAYGFAALVSHNENLNSPKQYIRHLAHKQNASCVQNVW